jgi:hypothetical protein
MAGFEGRIKSGTAGGFGRDFLNPNKIGKTTKLNETLLTHA